MSKYEVTQTKKHNFVVIISLGESYFARTIEVLRNSCEKTTLNANVQLPLLFRNRPIHRMFTSRVRKPRA